MLYKHSDGDSLATFLETLQGEVTADFFSSSGDACPASLRDVRAEGTHTPTTEIIDNTSPTEGGHAGPSFTGSPAAQHPLHQEFEVAKSKASRKKSTTYPRAQTTQPDRGGQPEEAVVRSSTPQDHAQQHAPRNRQPKGGASGSAHTGARKGNSKGAGTGRTIPVKQPTFASFARARERGRFAALDDDDASSDGENSASGADDAPYAYASDADLTRVHSSHMHDSHGLETTVFDVMSTTGSANAVEDGQEGSDMDCDDTSDASGYVGSSAPLHTQSPALTPGSGGGTSRTRGFAGWGGITKPT
ncbi:hypothetical protein PF008_g3093 [Phytophthora fragariae]|uniref:Uncharacterized protein n=1 Tax=Phytophthora fragariae TaxID=53985 RepID=A0A6G0SH07_9STRA|nr:hypothetical protein PF008_g3093 [Phytophthora fragariae]